MISLNIFIAYKAARDWA